MSAAATSPSSPSSLQLKSRIAGGLYPFSVLTAALGVGFLHGRLAHAVGLIAVAGMVAVTVLVYVILRPVDKNLVFLATTINLVGCLFEAGRFSPQGVDIAVVMTGFYCLLIAIVLLRANFLPRLLVLPMALAGLGWLSFMSPSLASSLSPWNLACGLIGEAAFFLWLLLKGLDTQRWQQQNDAR